MSVAEKRWRVQFYPYGQLHGRGWCVCDGYLEVWGTSVLASFPTEADACAFRDARNVWEGELDPPSPETYGGWVWFGPADGSGRADG